MFESSGISDGCMFKQQNSDYITTTGTLGNRTTTIPYPDGIDKTAILIGLSILYQDTNYVIHTNLESVSLSDSGIVVTITSGSVFSGCTCVAYSKTV